MASTLPGLGACVAKLRIAVEDLRVSNRFRFVAPSQGPDGPAAFAPGLLN